MTNRMRQTPSRVDRREDRVTRRLAGLDALSLLRALVNEPTPNLSRSGSCAGFLRCTHGIIFTRRDVQRSSDYVCKVRLSETPRFLFNSSLEGNFRRSIDLPTRATRSKTKPECADPRRLRAEQPLARHKMLGSL